MAGRASRRRPGQLVGGGEGGVVEERCALAAAVGVGVPR